MLSKSAATEATHRAVIWRNKLPEPLIIGPPKSPPPAVDPLDKIARRPAQAKNAAV
jgi:hypothetical protein